MYPRNAELFSDEELLEMVGSRQGFPGSSSPGGLIDQVDENFNRTKRSAFGSQINRSKKETPELVIVAGVLLLRLCLWGLFRKAAKQGLEISML